MMTCEPSATCWPRPNHPMPRSDAAARSWSGPSAPGHASAGRQRAAGAADSRAGWLAGGLGVVAAATAAAVVLSSGSTPAVPRGNPPVTGGASAARLEGQRILLAAALSAAAQPSGTYWHFTVKTTMSGCKRDRPGVGRP